MDIRDSLKIALEYLKDNKFTDPYFESRYILSEILEKDLAFLISHSEYSLTEFEERKFLEILNRRKKGEPLQYIFGKTYFYKDEFIIHNGVLIPRQDTEISVSVLEKIISKKDKIDFLEIGVGSGIVILSMAKEYLNSNFVGCDISDLALDNANENLKKFELKNVTLIKSNIYSNIIGKFDIIYSNPPYIKTSEIDNLQVEVKDYEPRLALDGGEDGLFIYRKIINDLDSYLKEDGYLVLEIGYDQANDLKDLLKGYKVKIYKDLSARDRVVVAQKEKICTKI